MSTRYRSSIFTVLAGFVLAAGLAAGVGGSPRPLPTLAQEGVELTQLAAPPLREPAWRYDGEATVTADTATIAGLLIAVSGLDAAPADGRFTLAGTLSLTETAAGPQTTTWTGAGQMTVYAHDPPLAPGAGSAEFATGLPVGVYDATVQMSQITDGAGQAVSTGTLSLTQTAAYTFTLDGIGYRFGSLDLVLAANLTGGQTDTPDRIGIFGTAAVGARTDRPSDSGAADTSVADTGATNGATNGAAASPAATDDACAAVAAWTEPTAARLTTAADQRAIVLSGVDLTVEDIDAALANATTLLAEQQAAATPPDAATAASLAVTTLSTDARAYQLILVAVDSGDQGLIDQATALLTDAQNLSDRAIATLAMLAPDCDAS